MSRHAIKIESKDASTFVYGYDRPLQEYFFQYWNDNQEVVHSGEGSHTVLLDEMCAIGMEKFPEAHVDACAMDLVIEQ